MPVPWLRRVVPLLFFLPLLTGVRVVAQPADTFTFAQLCDPQLGMGGYEHDLQAFEQAARQVNALKADFTLICGDLVNEASDETFSDFNHVRAQFDKPAYCAPGNHDVSDAPSLAHYRRFLGEDYYAFDHKGLLFVVVNTQLWKTPIEGESEKHDAWVTKTLLTALDAGTPVIVAGHYPLYIEDPNEAEEYFNLPIEKRQELLALFKKCGVRAYLSGHAHKTIVNEYQGIKLVSGPVTSKRFDENPLGFTRWKVTPGAELEYKFIALELSLPDADSSEAATQNAAPPPPASAWQGQHTSPAEWTEPRMFHMPFDEDYAAQIVVDHVPRDEVSGERIHSSNNAYWFAVQSADRFRPGPWNATILIDNEREELIQIQLLDSQYDPTVTWVNEKLLFISVWWGRVLGTDMVFDVEREAFMFRDMKHDGRIAFEQFQESRRVVRGIGKKKH